MKTSAIESCLLRVYCVVSDKSGDKTLHEAILEAARAAGIVGASIFQAKMGFGREGQFYSDLIDVDSERQPIIVEIVDQIDRIDAFVPTVHFLVGERRLITMARAQTIVCPTENNLAA